MVGLVIKMIWGKDSVFLKCVFWMWEFRGGKEGLGRDGEVGG